eukprot:GILI01029747.1.p1 GENE.GILI01029747.1~~GILI01029747.1.p1  ORF type:complete len:307 (+),score=75.08 GILI01029747.1:69-923(+)
MDVTRRNFHEVFPLIKQAIEEAQYLAFDTEFCGQNTNLRDAFHHFDSLEDRYQKVVRATHYFLVNQFGLSTFKWDEEKRVFVSKSFNFYIFPHPSDGRDDCFVSQASSLHFLINNGFDFNKLFRDGLTYSHLKLKAVAESPLEIGEGSFTLGDGTNQAIEDMANQIESFLQASSKKALIRNPKPKAMKKIFNELTKRFKGRASLTYANSSNTAFLKEQFLLQQKASKSHPASASSPSSSSSSSSSTISTEDLGLLLDLFFSFSFSFSCFSFSSRSKNLTYSFIC